MESLLQEAFTCNEDSKTGTIELRFQKIPQSGSILLMDSMVLGLNEVKKQYGKKYILLKFEEV